MAEVVHPIYVGSDDFEKLKTCLDDNPEYLLFRTSSGDTLKVDLKNKREDTGGAENIVVRWMKDIKNKANNYTSSSAALNEIKSYCEAYLEF